MFENIEIVSLDPKSVYIFPKRHSYEGIKKNVDIIHKLADTETGGVIFCFGDDLDYKPEHEFEICYPMLRNDFKKFNIHEFKVLQRSDVVIGDYIGDYESIPKALLHLQEYAKQQGYVTCMPFCITYQKGKTAKFSKNPPPFDMQLSIPVTKIEE